MARTLKNSRVVPEKRDDRNFGSEDPEAKGTDAQVRANTATQALAASTGQAGLEEGNAWKQALQNSTGS